jgi:hypothetical protein
MCSHETYMDCPYYEQLMYVGDTRLECLTTYVTSHDDRLPRKAIDTFARSRLPSDLTQSRFPSRRTQIIPTFSLWWVAMLHDYALWRGDLPMIRAHMPKARGVIESFLANRGDDGLIDPPPGWNFYDWVPGWGGGMPLGTDAGVIGLLNWHVIYTLGKLKDLETWFGEKELAARADRLAKELAPNASKQFWNADRKVFSDDREHTSFSEHSQCLALLGGYLDADRAKQVGQSLLSDDKLARTTISFSHYLFETYRQLGRTERTLQRMNLWFDLPKMGFKTTPEMPEPTRSDCHGWGAHPLYHYFASILGVRPGEIGFKSVKIAPQLGPIKHAAGTLVHPQGEIALDVEGDANHIRGTVVLPPGLSGRIEFAGNQLELSPGRRDFEL